MRNPFQTESFKQLQEHWYLKLRESGFTDIESDNVPHRERPGYATGRNSKTRGSNAYRNEVCAEAAYRYYQLAVQFLEEAEFSTDLERRIWTFHANGYSLRAIAAVVGRDKDHVHGVVRIFRARIIG